MTFVIFLVSVAILEYILRRRSLGDKTGTSLSDEAYGKAEQEHPVGGSLRQLGNVLEQYGRGRQPEQEGTVQTPGKTAVN